MQIIHLSDTHLGRGHNNERFARVVDDILNAPSLNDAMVIHTGDLIDKSVDVDMNEGLRLLKKLHQHGRTVLLCPGNHDYGSGCAIDRDRATRFQDLFGDWIFGTRPRAFPVLNLTPECAFIGLDSNQGELRWHDHLFAEGRIGKEQLEALKDLLNSDPVRQRPRRLLYMHHHPFLDAFAVRPTLSDPRPWANFIAWHTRRFRRLQDAYSLMQCLRDRVDLMLFGHFHFGLDYSAESRHYGVPLALDGSSTTCTDMDTDRMRYRVLTTENGSVLTRTVMLD